MAGREYSFSVVLDCWHWMLPKDTALPMRSDRDRIVSADDARMLYRVADRHLPFARLLNELKLPLVAVPSETRLYLGVRCENELQARRRTIDIFHAMTRRPTFARALQHDLRLWRARATRKYLTLWWPGVEVWQDWMH